MLKNSSLFEAWSIEEKNINDEWHPGIKTMIKNGINFQNNNTNSELMFNFLNV